MNKSFTLIEILVVIVVIGVLSAFILVGMSSITNSANIARGKAFLNSLDNSLLLARVSQWKLDSDANDSWGANTGTMNNFPASPWKSSSECVSNECLSFGGTDDYIDCGSNNDLNIVSTITITAWTKTSSSGYNTVIHKGYSGWASGYWLCVKSGSINDNRFGIEGVNIGDWGTYPSDGKWHYVVGTYSQTEGKTKVYLDSINKLDRAVTGTPTGFSGETLLIGRVKDATYPFNGSIDDIRIYNQVITISEIQQNYYIGLSGLFENNSIGLEEFNQRLVELKNNLANN